MISAVTFDVWETLITDPVDISKERSVSRVRLMGRALSEAGCEVPESQLWRAYEWCWDECVRLWETNVDFSTSLQVEMILNVADGSLKGKLSPEALASFTSAYIDPIFDFPPLRKDGLPQVLLDAKALGLKVGLVCNTGRSPGWAVRRILSQHGVLDHFDAVAFSDEERIRKPAPDIFLGVLSSLHVSPEHAVHVGDNLVTDIGGAKGLGMKAVLIGKGVGEDTGFVPDARIANLSELIPYLRANL